MASRSVSIRHSITSFYGNSECSTSPQRASAIVVFVSAGRKARGRRLSRSPLLVPAASARSALPPLPQTLACLPGLSQSRKHQFSSRTPGVTNKGTNTHYLFKPSPCQHFQAQSEHARSLQHDGVLPPTRAACRLPVSRPGQKALSALPTAVRLVQDPHSNGAWTTLSREHS
jgi:hypothetical protein